MSKRNEPMSNSESSLVLMGDAVIDLLAIMAAMTLISRFVSNILALPLLVIALTVMAFWKFLLVRKNGRHPCLSMISKKLLQNHKSASNFLWPSLVSIAALFVLSIYSISSTQSDLNVANGFYDTMERMMFSVAIDKVFFIRLVISVLNYLGFIKMKFATEAI